MANKFLQVKCKKCKNEQVIFERPASVVKCNVCDEILAVPRGAKGIIDAKVLSVMK